MNLLHIKYEGNKNEKVSPAILFFFWYFKIAVDAIT